MLKNIFVSWRVAVEIMNRTPYSRDVCDAMRAEERIVAGEFRQTPFPLRMRRSQMRCAAHDPCRTLRVSGRGIFGALWIVKENQTRVLALHEATEVRPVAGDQENLQHRDDNARHHFVHARSHEGVKEQDVDDDRRKNG